MCIRHCLKHGICLSSEGFWGFPMNRDLRLAKKIFEESRPAGISKKSDEAKFAPKAHQPALELSNAWLTQKPDVDA